MSVAFRPGGGLVTYLLAPHDSLDRELWALDVETGEARRLLEPPGGGVREDALTRDEQLRRERQRELGLGISAYSWAADAPVLLLPQPDGAWVAGGDGSGLRLAVEGTVLDPRLSPDGSSVAYVLDGELWVDGRQLTTDADAAAGRTNGLAEFVAQEEMGRAHGFWWSPDGTMLAFCQVDESAVPEFRIVHAEPLDEEVHRYPFAGGPNAAVRLGVVPADGSAPPRWLDTGEDEYLVRVDWLADGALAVQNQDRSQGRVTLCRVDPATGERTWLLDETSTSWVNLHDHLRPLADGGFVWSSERSGFRHLEVRAADGSVERVLTSGEWQVDTVDGVDQDRGLVWFSGTRHGATERHLYEVPLAGGEPRRVTSEPGTHHVTVHAPSGLFVDVHSSSGTQPTATLRRLADGTVVHRFFDRPDERVERLGLRAPRLATLPGADGTPLHVALYEPGGEPPWPTLVYVYGGPHVQLVAESWALTAAMRAQFLRGLGYLVVVADNRGSARRGLAFESALHLRMGQVEVDDQVAVIEALAGQGLVDPDRVGVFGWSYGGYLAAMLLARAPGVFRAAVAGSPVTSWDGYDTHYTERYLSTPEDNPDGYEASAVFPYVAGIEGDLLLVHGLLDENVHFRHTARLVSRLIAARKRYELLLFPGERHGPRRFEDRVYLEERLRHFFDRALLDRP